MGFLDRVGKIAGAVGGTAKSSFGVVSDLASAPFKDDEIDGITGTIKHTARKRVAEFLTNTVGPEGIGGQVFGAIPKPVRQGPMKVIDPPLRFFEWVYKEGIAQPLSTAYLTNARNSAWEPLRSAFTYGNPMDKSIFGKVWSVKNAIENPDELVTSPDEIRKSYKQAQTVSPGQALMIQGARVDPDDAEALNELQGTDAYKYGSGAADAFVRIYADPTVGVGKLAQAGKLRYLAKADDALEAGADADKVMDATRASEAGAEALAKADEGEIIVTGVVPDVAPRAIPFTGGRTLAKKAIAGQADVNRFMGSTRYSQFRDSAFGKNAAEIRDQYFPDDPNGSWISSILADAKTPEAFDTATRTLLGDQQAVLRIREESATLTNQIARLYGEEEMLRSLGDKGFELRNSPQRLEAIRAELDELYDQGSRLAREDYALNSLREVPKHSRTGAARVAVTRSELYQHSPFAAPLRKTFNMRPQRLVNLHDSSGDVQLDRTLKKSPLAQEVRDRYRSEYMAAGDDITRQAILVRAENDAVRAVMKDAGIADEDITKVLAEAERGRTRAQQILQSRAYDGEGRSRVFFEGDDGIPTEVPLLVSQNANVVPLVDMDKVLKAAARIKRQRVATGKQSANAAQKAGAKAAESVVGDVARTTGAISVEGLEAFYRAWRPGTLLRFGWPIRVVTDEQMRIVAKIGVMAQMDNLITVAKNSIADRPRLTYGAPDANGIQRAKGIQRTPLELRVPGERNFKVRNHQIQSALGGLPGDARNVYYELASARASMDAVIGKTERGIIDRLRGVGDTSTVRGAEDATGRGSQGAITRSGQWSGHIEPTNKSYGAAWSDAVNYQLGKDAMGRKFLANESVDDVVRWLSSDKAGRAYAARNKIRSRNLRAWAEDVEDQVERYTLGSDELKQAALAGKASTDDLVRLAPDVAERPIVHGEELAQAMGTSEIQRVINTSIETLYKAFGAGPSNKFSRHPYFDHVYRQEATRQLDMLDEATWGRDLTAEDYERVVSKSREVALGETRKLLYDLAEESELAHMMRFMMPFYSAWQEVITRWTGLALENPAFVARARMVWRSPEKAGLVMDEQGHSIDENGVARDSEGNIVEAGRDRYIAFTLPDWVTDVPHKKHLAFNKKSFNMITAGPPGFGPPVQLAVNEAVKDSPELEDSVKWALPFGTTQEWTEIAIPATAKRLLKDDEDRTEKNNLYRIYFDDLTTYNIEQERYEAGLRKTPPEKPTFDSAREKARSIRHLRALAQYTMPVAPLVRSPYEPYRNALRQARERYAENEMALADEDGNERTPDEWFIEEYGEEFFPLTQSFSRSMDGVPPTIEAFYARKENKELVEKYPELGGFIIGKEGRGEFSRSVYVSQLANSLSATSDNKQREGYSFDEIKDQPEIRLGWIKYTKAMDLIEAAREERDLPNLQVKAARDLAEKKRFLIESIADEHPAWYEEMQKRDAGKFNRTLKAFKEISKDEWQQKHNPAIPSLNEYMRLRGLVIGALKERRARGGSANLEATTNRDLQQKWETLKSNLVEGNLAFSETYYRYLENDPMEVGR